MLTTLQFSLVPGFVFNFVNEWVGKWSKLWERKIYTSCFCLLVGETPNTLVHSYPNRCNEYNGHLACFTYWSLYEWAAIWLTTFSNAFTELKTVYFDKTVTGVGSQKSFSIGLGNCSALIKQHALAWTNADPVHWRMYASPGINESIHGYTSDWFWYIAKLCNQYVSCVLIIINRY